MAYSFNKKLKILQKILKNYKKYLKNCVEIKCYVEYDYIVIEKINITHNNGRPSVKIPISDIDLTIIRYRALLYQKKTSIKPYKKALKETDIINLRETLKETIN